MQLLKRIKNFGKSSSVGDCAIDTQDIFDVLHPERRRHVVRILDSDGQMSLRELSERISEIEGSDRQAVYVALYQNHVPVLDRHAVVRFDGDAGTVRPGESFEAVSRALSCVRDRC